MKRIYYWYDLNFIEHKIVAVSLIDARRQLLLQGKIAFKIKAGKFIRKSSFNRNDLLIITKQLATMIKAGLPLLESLHLLAQEHPKSHWQYLLTEIEQQISLGESLSIVLTQYKSVFPPLYSEIIATGELTGQLDLSFEQLTLQLEQTIHLEKSIKKAMRYPLFLLTVSLLVTLIMLLFVLPKFSDIYQSFDAQLPPFTQLIINTSNFLREKFWFGCLLTMLVFFCYRYYFKKRYQKKIDYFMLKTPLVGKIIQCHNLTHFFQTVSITQIAGIPLIAGLNAAANTLLNHNYRETIYQMIAGIEQGHSFSSVLQQQTLFPHLCYQLIQVGEESGTLDTMLEKLAYYYQEQNQTLTDNLTQLFEPTLMLMLALIVGGLIIAIYLPIFQLGEVIS